MMRIHRYRWMLRGAGVCLVFLAARVFGDGEEHFEQWLAKQHAAMSAWEALSAKWEAARVAVTTTPVEDLVLPISDDDGRIRAVLRAEKAHLLDDDLVFAWNVKIEMLLPDGKPDGILIAEDCLLDRKAKRGFCRGAVEVKKAPDHLKGRGMYFSTDSQFIKLKLLSECEIRTSRIPASFGRLS